MSELIEKLYKDYKIYTYDEEYIKIGEKILNKDYKIEHEIKNTERNYVGKININGKSYILKSPKAETVIPQRKIQSIFKRGEALNTFLNVNKAISEGIDAFVKPLLVIRKKKVFLKESYILFEYIDGEKLESIRDIDEVITLIKILHGKNIYHGDLNTSNFIKINGEIKILDTQCKKEKLWWFKRTYDILTLKSDLLVMGYKYPVKEKYGRLPKDLGYYLACTIKNFKKLKIVNIIRDGKKILRKRGWKI